MEDYIFTSERVNQAAKKQQEWSCKCVSLSLEIYSKK